MSSAEEYRRAAWDCLKLSEATSNLQSRASMLNLAQYWVRLAEVAERNKKEYGPAKYYGPAWYQAKAREYATRAQSVTDPGQRAELLRFAGMWLSLMEPIEGELRGAYESPPRLAALGILERGNGVRSEWHLAAGRSMRSTVLARPRPFG
jgi:hypothetical protein